MIKQIAASVLSADFSCLKQEIEQINNSDNDLLHLDVMDGMFVPNISFGQPIIKSIKQYSKNPLDVHLMIRQPDRYFDDFKSCGADILTVHYEACEHLNRSLSSIKQKGMRCGVAVNPHTPVILLKDILYLADIVLIMSVNPGFGGQKFIDNTYNKIQELKQMILSQNLSTLIEIDGGVNVDNSKKLFACGADILVAGSCVFGSKDRAKTISLLKQ